MTQFIQNRSILPSIVILGVFFILLSPTGAFANGTTSGQLIINAEQPGGGTLPISPGELSVQFQNIEGSDTQFADTNSTVTTTVDTGFDIADITFPSNGNVAAGTNRAAKFLVVNESNNAQNIDFSASHLDFSDSDTENDSFILELFFQTGDVAFDTSTATRVSGSDGTIPFAEGETKSVFAVVTPKSNATVGDSIRSGVFVTDNAPITGPGTNDDGLVGDQWEDSVPIAVADNDDTQAASFITTLAGPSLEVIKTISSSSGSFRPGDTIEYTITARNIGSQDADTVTLVDAVPDSTAYVKGTASVVDNGNPDGAHTGATAGAEFGFDDDFDLATDPGLSADGDLPGSNGDPVPLVVTIFWPLDSISSGSPPGNEVQLTYTVQIE